MTKQTPRAHSVDEYISQAAHNHEFARYIRENKTDCLDWSATCLFYAAVHYINAYFKKIGKQIPRRHSSPDPRSPGRLNIIQTDSSLSAIYDQYRNLDDESRDARYELKMISASDYDSFLLPQFEAIKTFIIPKVTT